METSLQSGHRCCVNLTAMRLDRSAHNGQAKPRALDITLGMMFFNPVKTFKNIGQIISRNTNAIGTDRYFDLPLILLGCYSHLER